MTRTFRPSGAGRYFIAAFMLVWLAGWGVGGAFPLFALSRVFRSMAHAGSRATLAIIILFLAVWLTLWTAGLATALVQLVRMLWGDDVIAVTSEGLEVVRRGGPFRRRYMFERAAIRRIRLRPRGNAVLIDTEKGTQVLTAFGSPVERQEAVDWLIRALSLPDEAALAAAAMPPESWDVTGEGDATCLRKVRPRARFVRSGIAWLVTALVATGWIASSGNDVMLNVPGLVLTLLFALAAALSTWGRREWIVRQGEMTFRRSFVFWTSERAFRNARLDLTHHTDSDDDNHFTLVVVDGEARRTVHSQMNDSKEVVDLGHWLAARTGFRFTPDVQSAGPAAAR